MSDSLASRRSPPSSWSLCFLTSSTSRPPRGSVTSCARRPRSSGKPIARRFVSRKSAGVTTLACSTATTCCQSRCWRVSRSTGAGGGAATRGRRTLAALALVINVGFLRDPLAVRLPDAAVLPALCGAWLVGQGLQASTRWRRVTAVSPLAVVTALATSSIVIVGNVSENLNRTDLGRGLLMRANGAAAACGRTQERFALRHIPSDRVTSSCRSEYLDRCTTVEHRLFVAGYAPELFTYARRLFAGGHGQFIQGYQVSPAAQQRIVERLERQFVFALMLSDEERQWRAESVTVDAFIRANFEPMPRYRWGTTAPFECWPHWC